MTMMDVVGTHPVTFDRIAFVNGTKLLTRKNIQSRVPGIVTSPLLNITGYDKLSLPFLHHLITKILDL